MVGSCNESRWRGVDAGLMLHFFARVARAEVRQDGSSSGSVSSWNEAAGFSGRRGGV